MSNNVNTNVNQILAGLQIGHRISQENGQFVSKEKTRFNRSSMTADKLRAAAQYIQDNANQIDAQTLATMNNTLKLRITHLESYRGNFFNRLFRFQTLNVAFTALKDFEATVQVAIVVKGQPQQAALPNPQPRASLAAPQQEENSPKLPQQVPPPPPAPPKAPSTNAQSTEAPPPPPPPPFGSVPPPPPAPGMPGPAPKTEVKFPSFKVEDYTDIPALQDLDANGATADTVEKAMQALDAALQYRSLLSNNYEESKQKLTAAYAALNDLTEKEITNLSKALGIRTEFNKLYSQAKEKNKTSFQYKNITIYLDPRASIQDPKKEMTYEKALEDLDKKVIAFDRFEDHLKTQARLLVTLHSFSATTFEDFKVKSDQNKKNLSEQIKSHAQQIKGLKDQARDLEKQNLSKDQKKISQERIQQEIRNIEKKKVQLENKREKLAKILEDERSLLMNYPLTNSEDLGKVGKSLLKQLTQTPQTLEPIKKLFKTYLTSDFEQAKNLPELAKTFNDKSKELNTLKSNLDKFAKATWKRRSTQVVTKPVTTPTDQLGNVAASISNNALFMQRQASMKNLANANNTNQQSAIDSLIDG